MPDRPPRLVATDLDGTLLRSDGTLSPRTVETLAAVEQLGTEVVFVTGRPPRWMTTVADHVGGHGLAVCSNGAVLVDLRDGTYLRETSLAPALLAELVGKVTGEVPGVAFAVEYGWDFAAQREYAALEPHRVVEAADLSAAPAAKLLVKHPDADSDGLLARLEVAVGDLATCTHSGLGAGLVEVSALGVTKASALAELCADRGIDAADVMAFGDMPNDLPMLAWAGRPYAVANAHPAVLSAVRNHAPANDEDGVAQTLATIFDLPDSDPRNPHPVTP